MKTGKLKPVTGHSRKDESKESLDRKKNVKYGKGGHALRSKHFGTFS